jgi:hypothetical protein
VADDTTWKSGLTNISRADQFKGDIKKSSWLPDANVAFIYRAYATYNSSLKITSPSPQDNVYTAVQDTDSGVVIQVDASKCPDWTKLEFHDGAKLLGTITSGPTQFTATNLTPGFHTFSVLGTDASGNVQTCNCTMVAIRE